MLHAFDFASEHSDVAITDPLAVSHLAWDAVKEMGPVAQAKAKKKAEDDANDMCTRVLDQMLDSLEDIEEFAPQINHDDLKAKIEDAKNHFEFDFISKYSCMKQHDDAFKEVFYGKITDAVLESVSNDGKIYLYSREADEVYEPQTDQNNLMANILSDYLAEAHRMPREEEGWF